MIASEPSAPLVALPLGDLVVQVEATLDTTARGVAFGLLGGSAAALLTLAAALSPTVRGFGGMLGWALVAITAALLSLAAPPLSLVHPLCWVIATISGYAAVRASGVLTTSSLAPTGVILGLLASALLLGAQIGLNIPLSVGDPAPLLASSSAVLALLMLVSAAPFALARPEAVAAPAPLAVLIYALVLPTLGLPWMLRLVATQPVLPYSWAVLLALSGAVTALAAAAGALYQTRLRYSLHWLVLLQIGVALVAIGMADPIALGGALTLLFSLMLSGVIGAVAVSACERTTGSDDYTVAGLRLPQIGLIWLGAGMVALGVPPLFSAWARLWIFESTLAIFPWILPALLAAHVLALLAVLMPLARFWGGTPGNTGAPHLGRSDWLASGVPLGILLVLGSAPQLAWQFWLSTAPNAPIAAPISPLTQGALVGGGALLLLLGGLIMRAPSAHTLTSDPATPPVRLPPTALADQLAPISALGRPTTILRSLWNALDIFSHGVRFVMIAFEQRYYLLGVLMALIVVMLLMAQL
jgi:hypothetical protein